MLGECSCVLGCKDGSLNVKCETPNFLCVKGKENCGHSLKKCCRLSTKKCLLFVYQFKWQYMMYSYSSFVWKIFITSRANMLVRKNKALAWEYKTRGSYLFQFLIKDLCCIRMKAASPSCNMQCVVRDILCVAHHWSSARTSEDSLLPMILCMLGKT